MLNTKRIVDHLTGKGIVKEILVVLSKNFTDFPEIQEAYLQKMCALQTELEGTPSLTVQEEMDAIEKQMISNLLFSAYLGIKANLDNFINPVATSFLDLDHDVYLRENTAHMLPEYEYAQNTRIRFFAQLSPEQRERYECVIEYTSYLETVVPKIAHYYGYILGNELLPRIIPGYCADAIQTARYTAMVKEYFGLQNRT